MDLATIICEYIYGSFVIIKNSIEVLMEVFEMEIEKVYSIATTINNAIFMTLGKALDAIILIVTKALQALVSALNKKFDTGTWSFCANAFRCNFFLEQILDPDSLIAKTIRKIFEGEDDCYCTKQADGSVLVTEDNENSSESIYNFQQTLYDIATDYENFKAQICNGLSLDLSIDLFTDLCLDYLKQLNQWKTKIQAKINSLRKLCQGLLESFRNSKLFDLLVELQAFFECVIDSELCANVDTAKSFYNSVLSKLNLIESGAGDFMLSPNFENEILGTAKSFNAKVDSGIKKVEEVIDKLSSSSNIRGASNALDLTKSIIGVTHVINDGVHGRELEWNKIPIVDYSTKTWREISANYKATHSKTTTDPETALKTNKCSTLDDILLETLADGDATDYIEVKTGTDTSHAQEIIEINDKFYTVADAAKQIYTGEGDLALINYCKNVGGLLNIDDILTRY